MKKTFVLRWLQLIFMVVLVGGVIGFGCSSDTVNPGDSGNNVECLQIADMPEWELIDFKQDYSIRIPKEYEGYGMVGFEGNIFEKFRSDESVRLGYSFCSTLYCQDFGFILESPSPDSLIVTDEAGNVSVMMKRFSLCSGEESVGLLYLSSDNPVEGTYFMKVDGEYHEALRLKFAEERREEVMNILKSISHD